MSTPMEFFFKNCDIELFHFTGLTTHLKSQNVIAKAVEFLNQITGLSTFQSETWNSLADTSDTIRDILFNHISKNIFYELLLKNDSSATDRARYMISAAHQSFFKEEPNEYAKLEYYINELLILTAGLAQLIHLHTISQTPHAALSSSKYHQLTSEALVIKTMMDDLRLIQKEYLPHHSSTNSMNALGIYLRKKEKDPSQSSRQPNKPSKVTMWLPTATRKDSGTFANFTGMMDEENLRRKYDEKNIVPLAIWTSRRT